MRGVGMPPASYHSAFGRGPTVVLVHGLGTGALRRAVQEFLAASHGRDVISTASLALDACVATFNGVAMLRQQMRPDCRIHGIVADGGMAANVIPERDDVNNRVVAFSSFNFA